MSDASKGILLGAGGDPGKHADWLGVRCRFSISSGEDTVPFHGLVYLPAQEPDSGSAGVRVQLNAC